MRKTHFIGIGGIGMSALARMLLKKGGAVSGSDTKGSALTEQLEKLGATIFIGHAKEHVDRNSQVIISTAIDAENPELIAAKDFGCTILHRSELLEQLVSQKESLAVTGTHGKTTTSGLLAWTLNKCGLDPSFAVGGIVKGWNTNADHGKGPHFVIEADESDASFLRCDPLGWICLNIDFDHMDFYHTEENLVNAFRKFVSKGDPQFCFWNGDDVRLRNLQPHGYSYGLGEGNAIRALNIVQNGFKQQFDFVWNDLSLSGLEIGLLGLHNVHNALAVIALCLKLGVDERKLRDALRSFQGMGRRCDVKGDCHRILVLDDYAHHPTEIATTLQGIRKAIGQRRMVVVYQPHRFTRIRDCLGQFKTCFNQADRLVITDLYSAGEKPIPGISCHQVHDEVQKYSNIATDYYPRERLVERVYQTTRLGDVVVFMGAGDVTRASGELAEMVREKSPDVGTVHCSV
jgi:UDP-N-acetylmuramate--alanine ligase